MHLPSACHLWAGGRAKLIYSWMSPTYVSSSPGEFALLFNLFSLLALEEEEEEDAERCRHFSLPLSLSPSPWNLPLTRGPWDSPNVSQKEKKKGPQDKYVFNKQ